MKVNMQINLNTERNQRIRGRRKKVTWEDGENEGSITPENRKHTEDADRPGPLCATMAPETALIQLCISSGLSA